MRAKSELDLGAIEAEVAHEFELSHRLRRHHNVCRSILAEELRVMDHEQRLEYQEALEAEMESAREHERRKKTSAPRKGQRLRMLSYAYAAAIGDLRGQARSLNRSLSPRLRRPRSARRASTRTSTGPRRTSFAASRAARRCRRRAST